MNIVFSRVDNNPNLCTNHTCDPSPNRRKGKAIPIVEIIAPVAGAIIIVAVVLLIIWHKRKKRQGK
jgi:hypothetical protein